MEKFHLLSAEQTALKLNTDLKNGLSLQVYRDRLSKDGPNSLKEAKGKSPLSLFFEQFTDFLVIILLIAAAISFFLGEHIDGAMIMVIVVINSIVGFIQEYRVEKAIEQLKKLVVSNVTVYRDGKLLQIPSSDLVVGDLVNLEEGQKIPADIRLYQCYSLQTIEAALTGESTPIQKTTDPLSADSPIADQKNMAFSGTIVSSGKGLGIVIATAMNTQLGKIAHLVAQETSPPTPMQQKLDRLGKLIGKIVLVIALVVAGEEMLFGGQKIIDALIEGVALAVAAIPEGLPAVVTISLALGTKRLLKQNALIRNLPAAETLGSTDVICSDKTGTLTEGVMSVRQIYYQKKLYLLENLTGPQTELQKILEMGILASNARFSGDKIIGDTTEAALITAAIEHEINQDELIKKYPRVGELPFSSDRKMMSAIYTYDQGSLVASKGAVEVILKLCTKVDRGGKIENLTAKEKEEILNMAEEMAKNALRVLAFAYNEVKAPAYKETKQLRDENTEQDLIFLGLQGMMDPPRQDVKEAIQICQKQAGIRVIMITGDHLLTAQAVASELGIMGKSITGVDLDKLSEDEFNKMVEEINIYARVNPEHKIRIVKALKAHGHQVAMTGDGVNDAPALKAADIGIAMGITGTDVAKQSSDIILMDDHFNTIVTAVKEGRGIYDNIRKFVTYLLSANAMEVIVIAVAVLLGWPLPLLPIHLLWVNLVTDGLPAIALGVDPGREDIMTSPPAQFKEEIINKRFLILLSLVALLIGSAVLGIYGFMNLTSSLTSTTHAQTVAFTAVVLYEMLVILAIRSQYHLSFFSNKYLVLAIGTSIALQLIILYLPLSIFGNTLQSIFKVQALSLMDWAMILGVGAILLIIMKLILIKPKDAFST